VKDGGRIFQCDTYSGRSRDLVMYEIANDVAISRLKGLKSRSQEMYHVFQVEGYVWVRLWSTWSVVSVKNGKAKYRKLYHCLSQCAIKISK